MTEIRLWGLALSALASIYSPTRTSAQLPPSAAALVEIDATYEVRSNVTYHRAGSWEGKLDLYLPRNAEASTPVLVYFHGGGWVLGHRQDAVPHIIPYLNMGFAVANVSYRLGPEAPAPAAAVDSVCAVRWVGHHAEEYNLDVDRIVTSGLSSGGHLALFAALVPDDHELIQQCATVEEVVANSMKRLRVAAVVNWLGVTDVLDVVEGPNELVWAKQWLAGVATDWRLPRACLHCPT